VINIAPTVLTILIAILEEFKKKNEFTEQNIDAFFAHIKYFIDKNDPTKEMLAQELGTLYQQIFNLFYWCNNADLSRKLLAKKFIIDILFMTGISASQFLAMTPSSRDYYLDGIEQSSFYRDLVSNNNITFDLSLLCNFLGEYLNSFSEEIIWVLNLQTQDEMISFYFLLVKAKELGFLKIDNFNEYFSAFLNADFLNEVRILIKIITQIGVAVQNIPKILWTTLLDPRFIDWRIPNLLGIIADHFDDINAFNAERLITVLESFQIDEKTTIEDFVTQLEIKLEKTKQFVIDDIDEDLANKIWAARTLFYQLCRIGLSFSSFRALAPEFQNQLLSESSGYANAIFLLHERSFFSLDEIIELYDYNVSICHALMCAPEQEIYQTFARETLNHYRIGNSRQHEQQNLYQYQPAFFFHNHSVATSSEKTETEDDLSTTTSLNDLYSPRKR